MTWVVLFHDAFDAEFEGWVEGVQDELLAHAKVLAEFGPLRWQMSVMTII